MGNLMNTNNVFFVLLIISIYSVSPLTSLKISPGKSFPRIDIPIIYNDGDYQGKIFLGSPPKEFTMLFDTGSANLIVTSDMCSSETCRLHKRYSPNSSKTSKVIEHLSTQPNKHNYPELSNIHGRDMVNINFGTGRVSCVFGEDKVCIGTLCSEGNLILQAVYESREPFSDVTFDGIVGLSFTHLSLQPESNIIEMLYKQGKIHKKLFSFYFNFDVHKENQLSIGDIDPSKFTGPLHYYPVISANYWKIKIDSIYYGEQKLNICTNLVKCGGIVDTGTSMLGAPRAINSMFERQTLIEEDCTNIRSLKNIGIVISGKRYDLEPKYYVTCQNSMVFNGVGTLEKKKKCFGSWMNLDAISSTREINFILGGVFLKKYYTVFDRTNKKIGIADANH